MALNISKMFKNSAKNVGKGILKKIPPIFWFWAAGAIVSIALLLVVASLFLKTDDKGMTGNSSIQAKEFLNIDTSLKEYLLNFGGTDVTYNIGGKKFYLTYDDGYNNLTVGRDVYMSASEAAFSVKGYVSDTESGPIKQVENVYKYAMEKIKDGRCIYIEQDLSDKIASNIRDDKMRHVENLAKRLNTTFSIQQKYALCALYYRGISTISEFENTWKTASNNYKKDSWEFNKFIWEKWYCMQTGGHSDAGGYVKGLDAQFETFVKGVTSWEEKNIFSRSNLIYFTSNEINTYWTCGASEFTLLRNSSNEKEIFTTVINESLGAMGGTGSISSSSGSGYTKVVTVGTKKYKVYNQGYYGGNIASSGCSISSEAIVISGYKPDLNHTPATLAQKYNNNYPRSLSQIASDLTNLGIKSTVNTTNNADDNVKIHSKAVKDIQNNLSKGKPVIILVREGPESKYTSIAHYMALIGYNEKNMPIIADPNGGIVWTEDTVRDLVEKYIYYNSPSGAEQGYVLID